MGATLVVLALLGAVILANSRMVAHKKLRSLDTFVGGGLVTLALVFAGYFYL